MSAKILLIIPSFNVESEITDVISDLSRHNTLIIDDGSCDKTYETAHKLGFLVVQHKKNLGVSAAIRTGEQYAINNGYTHVVLMDADGQHPPELFENFCTALSTADFVLGDRFTSLDTITPQKVASNLFASMLMKEVTGIFIRDIACGFRGYRLKNESLDYVSQGYSEIYRQVIAAALSENILRRVTVPAIYDMTRPIITRRTELVALCDSLYHYSKGNLLLSTIVNLSTAKSDIALQIDDIPFCADYLYESDSYLFSTDMLKATILYGT